MKATAKRRGDMAFLRKLPTQMLLDWISDATSDDIAITLSTFWLGMSPRFKDVKLLDIFDLCVSVIRERVANRQRKKRK